MRYREEGVPLIVLAGREYGSGSSRDWAAKGPRLLGVLAVIAESLERIHRSNLIGMGILPLEFLPGQSAASLGLTGRERFTLRGLQDLRPRSRLTVAVESDEGAKSAFDVLVRIDTPVELEYYVNGGILQTVMRQMMRKS
jgi:aconitate hydratase